MSHKGTHYQFLRKMLIDIDITPLTAASKASQIILGAVTKGENWTLEQSQRMNLLGGAFASVGANQAVGKGCLDSELLIP